MLQINRRVVLHRAQADFRRSDALYRGFVGGRGAGKTWVGSYDLIRRARRGRTYCYASPTSVMMRDITFPTFEAIARDLGVWDAAAVRLNPYPTVRLTTGATVRFRTADDPEKLRGPNLSGVVLDEASLMPEAAYSIAIACLREAGQQGWLSAQFTPAGLTHWTYEVFGCGKPDTAVFHAKSRDNPFLPAGFHDTLSRQYSGLRAMQELEGRFVALEGAEWPPEYFPDTVWFDVWPEELTLRTIALDPSKGRTDKPGDYSAIVLLGRGKDGTLWVEADLANDRQAERIVEDSIGLQSRFKADVFAVETNNFQELLATQIANVSRNRGIMVPVRGYVNTVNKEVRIRRLGPYLQQKCLRFRNTPGTRLLVGQMRDFPVADHDDGPDALELALRAMIDLHNGRQRRGPSRLQA